MKQNYKAAIDFILKWEGGYVDHPKDPGGATNYGITLKTAQAFWKPDATKADLRSIPMAVVHDIYRKNYADKVGFDSLPSGLDLCAFDAAVLSGPAKAKRFLQDATSVEQYQGKRLAFYQQLKHWDTFGKGWARRIDAGTKEANKLKATPSVTKDIAKTLAPVVIAGGAATQVPDVFWTTTNITIASVIGFLALVGISLYIYNRYKKYKSITNVSLTVAK
jgi:lysozyme family protein